MNPETLLHPGATEEGRVRAAIAQWESWLRPVSADNPTGDDPAYDDDFQAMREEINKLTGIDPERLCQLAEKLLRHTAKDIRVVTWYTLARLLREGEKGLAEGLLLLAAMTERYGAALHPQRPHARKAAMEWLNGDRLADALGRWPEATREDASLTAGALLALNNAMKSWPEDERPAFVGLCGALQTRLERSGGPGAIVPQNSSGPEMQKESCDALSLAPVKSGRDLLDQAKRLSVWLAEQPAGWLASHRLMKTVRWDTVDVIPPMDADGRTRLNPPRTEYRAQMKRLYLQQNWIELVEYAAQMFCEGVNHFCLDVQWYLWQGLSRAGQPWESFAGYILSDLALFLERLQGVETLAWSDGTPFADEVTLNWIAEKVKNDPMAFREEPVTVVHSDEENVLALESEAMAKGDSEGPEAALAWLQSRPEAISPRSRWLLRLLMARVAEQYGRNELALHLLGELAERAPQMTLSEWEPGLMFEVLARRLKLLRIKSTRSESDKARLMDEMEKLTADMIRIDPVRSLVLCS